MPQLGAEELGDCFAGLPPSYACDPRLFSTLLFLLRPVEMPCSLPSGFFQLKARKPAVQTQPPSKGSGG